MFKPSKFTKLPVTIEAAQTGDGYDQDMEIMEWCGGNWEEFDAISNAGYLFSIPTLEGSMHVTKTDYVIKGVQGEFYPCKPDIFGQTYKCADQS
jgi:hypothetical protein